MSTLDEASLAEHGDTWRRRGWVLVEGLVPTELIDTAVETMWDVFPPPAFFHRSPADARVAEFWARRDPDLLFPEPPANAPAFRPDQSLGVRELPVAAPKLNALALQPGILRFVRSAMQTPDIQLYLAQLWAKYTGVTDYEQPLHRDHNPLNDVLDASVARRMVLP